MRRRDVSLTIAVCVSLLAHGAIVVWAADEYRREQLAMLLGFGRLPRGMAGMSEIRQTQQIEAPQYLLPPVEPLPQREVLREPEPRPLVLPPKPMPKVPEPEESPLGDAIGGGEATARSSGEKMMQALENRQTQAALSKNPGMAGAVGQNGSGASSPASPRSVARPPTPKPAPQEKTAAGESSSGDGFLKRGAGASAPRQDEPALGVDTKQVLPPTPKVGAKALPPQLQQKPKALPGAREAEALRKSEGLRQDGKTAEAKARDDRERPSEKPAEKEVAGKETPEGKPIAPLPTVGPSPVTPFGEMQEKLKDLKAAADSTSPKGDIASKEERLKEGAVATPEPGTATETAKTEEGEKIQAEMTRSDPNSSKEQKENANSAAAAAQMAAIVAPVVPTPPQVEPSLASTPMPAQTGDGRAPGAAGGAGGDPGEEAESESDPFKKNGSITFTPGRVDAKFGRKVKWVRPRLTLAGQTDAFVRAKPNLTISVSTDETGKVIKVEVLDSSGAPDTVDLPIVRAVYSWWIEPPKDSKGNNKADTMVWRIELRGR